MNKDTPPDEVVVEVEIEVVTPMTAERADEIYKLALGLDDSELYEVISELIQDRQINLDTIDDLEEDLKRSRKELASRTRSEDFARASLNSKNEIIEILVNVASEILVWMRGEPLGDRTPAAKRFDDRKRRLSSALSPFNGEKRPLHEGWNMEDKKWSADKGKKK